jgi:hypothetical protein
VIVDEMVGETPCDVEVPKDSDWIQDDQIEFTFCLPDGREEKMVVELHGRRPSNPLAEFVAAPFFLAGGGLFVAAIAEDEDDEDSAWDRDEDKGKGNRFVVGAAGLGIAVIGAGLYGLFGGKSEGLKVHEVHMDFDGPETECTPSRTTEEPTETSPGNQDD